VIGVGLKFCAGGALNVIVWFALMTVSEKIRESKPAEFEATIEKV
jgi:hypothetical protein